MRYIICFLASLLIFSCSNQGKLNNYLVIYEFENLESISKQDIVKTIDVIKKRIQYIGVDNPLISLNNKSQLEVKVKSVYNIERLNSIIENQGNLEFWPLFKAEEFYPFVMQANELIKKERKHDSINPILDAIVSNSYQGAPELFYFKESDAVIITSYFNRNDVKALLPLEKKYTKFLFGIKNQEGTIPLYAVKSNREDKARITGENIIEAKQSYDAFGRPTVVIQMDEMGALKWENMTYDAFNEQTNIAVTVNNKVFSAPGVASGPIHGGNSEISGDFTLEEAQDLATILSSGQSIPKLNYLTSSTISK